MSHTKFWGRLSLAGLISLAALTGAFATWLTLLACGWGPLPNLELARTSDQAHSAAEEKAAEELAAEDARWVARDVEIPFSLARLRSRATSAPEAKHELAPGVFLTPAQLPGRLQIKPPANAMPPRGTPGQPGPAVSPDALPPNPFSTPNLLPLQKLPRQQIETDPPLPEPLQAVLPPNVPFGQAVDDDLTPEERVNVAVYERTNRSVVNLNTRGLKMDTLFLAEVPAEGAGSGSVLDKAGHLLTNFHVVEGALEMEVTLYDGKTYEARLIGADPINDVAVLKIDAPPASLFPVALGNSGRLKVGMRVYALGNPFGLERTLTTGIVSSLNRALKIRGNHTIKSIIQIDAAINPGNSGGPLLDGRGELVGMNTAIASKTGQNSGVGFAIPSSILERLVPELIQFGRVKRAEIGITRVYETEQGLLIASMTPGGPAEQAGLRGPQLVRRRRGPFVLESVDRTAADLILAINDQPTTTVEAFLEFLAQRQPGERVEVTVQRDGRPLKIVVRLGDSGSGDL